MDLIVVEPEVAGLGEMLADLIRGNLADEPGRAKLIQGHEGTVKLTVTDAEVEVGLRFTGQVLRIGPPGSRADLSIACDSATLMELTNVPLRFGMPDTLTAKGRAIAGKLLNGDIAVKGLPMQLPLMIRLQRLFTVTR